MAEQIIMYCGHCGNQTGFTIRGSCTLDKSVEEEMMEGHTEQLFEDISEWRLLQCITCSKPSLEYTHKTADYLNSYSDVDYEGEEIDVVPRTHEKNIVYPLGQPNLPNLPATIEKEYHDTLKVRNISPVACAVLARRTLEAIFTEENAAGRTLEAKVNNLIQSDRIPPLVADLVHLGRRIGNLGAHFDKEEVTEQDVSAMLEFLETILEYLYVLPAKVATVRARLTRNP